MISDLVQGLFLLAALMLARLTLVIMGLALVLGSIIATHRGKWWLAGYWEEYRPMWTRRDSP